MCVKEKAHLFLLYVGTHDDCATWIENNRNLTPDPDNKNTITYEVLNHSSENSDNRSELTEPDYEELLLEKITEKDLKYVFREVLIIQFFQ